MTDGRDIPGNSSTNSVTRDEFLVKRFGKTQDLLVMIHDVTAFYLFPAFSITF